MRYQNLLMPLCISITTLSEMDQDKYPKPTKFTIPTGFTVDYFLTSSVKIISHLQKNQIGEAQDFIYQEEENASRMMILVMFFGENLDYTALVLSVVNKKLTFDEAKKYLSVAE